MSNNSIEEVAATSGVSHWFQLYVIDPPEITDDLIARAEAVGCDALVVTTDAQNIGQRSWDIRERIKPINLTPRAVADDAIPVPWGTSILRPSTEEVGRGTTEG